MLKLENCRMNTRALEDNEALTYLGELSDKHSLVLEAVSTHSGCHPELGQIVLIEPSDGRWGMITLRSNPQDASQ